MTAGWQQQVYDQPAAAVAGDRASSNPFASYDAGPGGLVAGASGVTIGKFAWVTPPDDPNGTGTVVNSFGSGYPAGLVPRLQQGLNTTYLSNAGMTIVKGFAMTVIIAGDYWVVNDGTTEAIPGNKAYADFLTGAVSFAATGAPTTGASATGSSIAASTFSVTGSITGDVMNVTAVGSGTVVAGATISGTGVYSGTKVLSQLSGTAGGVGTYRVSVTEQTVAAGTTISGTYGTLTIGTLTTTPTFAVGDTLNATGSVVAGTKITQNLTGSGGSAGTMVVDNNTVVSSQTISAQSNVETNWYARSTGLAGEIVKISTIKLSGE